MTEAQSWVLIGVFAMIFIGMLTWQTVHLSNLFRAELGKLELGIEAKLAVIDRDIQALTRKVFGDDPL